VTFRRPRQPPTRKAGFTLIEVMVVMVVMVVVTVAVAAGVGNIRGASVQAEAGKVAIAVRYLYNLTSLSGRNHRLVFDLDTGAYWGEEQTSADPCESFLLPGEGADDGAPAAEGDKRASFQASPSKLLSKYTLDKGVRFSGVMTSHQTTLSTTGQAYIYFFPNGTTENALVYVEGDPDDVMSVEVKALLGTARLIKGKEPTDGFGRSEEER
jgi:prepilin-type N-terminal cleavage/methylation domain-containing protein